MSSNIFKLGCITSFSLAVPGAFITTTVIPGSTQGISWSEILSNPGYWLFYGQAFVSLSIFGVIVSAIVYKLHKSEGDAT